MKELFTCVYCGAKLYPDPDGKGWMVGYCPDCEKDTYREISAADAAEVQHDG